MPTCYRLTKKTRAHSAYDGEGARLYGGRWNSKGTRMVYTSATPSLAILETLVHLDSQAVLVKRFAFRTAEFDDVLCEKIEIPLLPEGWDGDIPISATQNFGDRWVREQRSAVLAVPSVLSPREWNYLLNPDHPDFQKLHFGPVLPYVFSPRFNR